MNTYPTTLIQAVGSKEKRESGRQVDRATNGAMMAREFYTSDKRMFTVLHAAATTAEKATHEAFVAANKLVSFFLVWQADAVTYTCKFGAQRPDYEPLGSGFWRITAYVEEA